MEATYGPKREATCTLKRSHLCKKVEATCGPKGKPLIHFKGNHLCTNEEAICVLERKPCSCLICGDCISLLIFLLDTYHSRHILFYKTTCTLKRSHLCNKVEATCGPEGKPLIHFKGNHLCTKEELRSHMCTWEKTLFFSDLWWLHIFVDIPIGYASL